MKTFAKIFVSCTLLLSSASCGEWLDVMPQGMTTEENLFSDYSGYRSALNGIYQQMASPSLYGRELSWGFVSALSQYYDFGSMDASQIYAYTEKMDYENKEVLDFLESIWQTAYNTIANCNALISHVEKADPDLFPYAESGEREMIYGEALAARALLHFELLRLFAAAPVVDLTAKAIPYSTTYPDKVPARYTTEEVLEKIIADFEAALPLLAVNDLNLDALKTASMRFASNDSRGLFFGFRGTRLHYWAVQGAAGPRLHVRLRLREGFGCGHRGLRRLFVVVPHYDQGRGAECQRRRETLRRHHFRGLRSVFEEELQQRDAVQPGSDHDFHPGPAQSEGAFLG